MVVPRAEAAPGESTCHVLELGTLAVDEDGLRIVATTVANLRAADVFLQLNSHRLRDCADLQRALGEARREGLELVVFLRRGGEKRTEWIERGQEEAAVEPREEAAAEPIAPAQPAPSPLAEETSPPVAAIAAPPPAAIAPPTAAAAVDGEAARAELSRQLALGRELQRSLPVRSTSRWVRRIDELLAARSTPSLAGVERIGSCYATIAEILAYRESTARTQAAGHNPAGLILEYGGGSEVTKWLERHPFLEESVLRPYDPERSFMTGQRMGRWSPDDAVRLLVEHALREGEQLDTELATAASSP
jgi:hypothetical protein